MCELYSDPLQKFIKKKLLCTDGQLKDISDLLKIDVTKMENQKPLTLIETGTQSRVFFAENEKDEKFQKNCLHFYATAACYLKDNFPFDKSILKCAQYLHPEKRNSISSTSGISNIALHVTRALENIYREYFKYVVQHQKNKCVTLLGKNDSRSS